MPDRYLDVFHELMSNRARSIVVMLSLAVGAICSIAIGYYSVYRIVTLLCD